MDELKKEIKEVSVVIPCYQNEKNIPDLFVELQKLADDNQHLSFQYVLIDDGSKDDTYLAIKKEVDDRVGFSAKIIKLVKNVGSYNALLAGMNYATGDCNVHLHADLQDPPDLIPDLVKEWEAGHKLVIAYRAERNDGFLQDLLSNTFHKLIKRYVLKNAPKGGFDLMLFDNEIRDHIVSMDENNIHLVYLFIWLNYPYKQIPYTRKKRLVGKSSYTFGKRIKLAFDTFIGFSSIPIKLIWKSGIVIILFSIAALVSSIIFDFYNSNYLILFTVLFVGGMLQTSMGILGEFVWRILDQSRNRPNYIVQSIYKSELKK